MIAQRFFKIIFFLYTFTFASLSHADGHKITDVICGGNTTLFIDGKSDMYDGKTTKNIVSEDGVLIISGGVWHINLPKKLNSISVHDTCRLKTKHWHGKITNLVHNTARDVVLDGFFNIDQLLKTGSGSLVVYWLDDSDQFVANIEAGKTYLAGQTKTLILNTINDSHFDGQHLRSGRVLIKAQDKSTTQVHPLHSLTVFGFNQSYVGYARPVSYSNLISEDQSSIVLEPFRSN